MFFPTRVLAAAGFVVLTATAASAFPFGWRPHVTPLMPRGPRAQLHGLALQASRAYWTQVTAPAPFGSNGAGTAVLLTDGSVLMHESNISSNWFKLTPDAYGNYVNGTWSQVASLPNGYEPEYYADAVLPDGRVLIEGGEYNGSPSPSWSSLGAIYDPLANSWTSVLPPPGWTNIGDAPGTVLADGTFMLGNCCTAQQALFNASSLSWTATGGGKGDSNNEEGWSLLPDGSVLVADVSNAPQSERYVPSSGTWRNAGSTIVYLPNAGEMGPQVLRPDGTVFVVGASGANAVYHIASGTWTAAQSFPKYNGAQLDVADGPGALLPGGHVLVVASPGVYQNPSFFYEFNGKKLIAVPGPPNGPGDPSYAFTMLVLPTGQILVTDQSNDVEIYSNPGKPKRAWAPTITSAPTSVSPGATYGLAGTYLNGFSQAGAYGDDSQAATNYPLVRIANNATGHVFYCRTHGHSSMAVANPAVVATNFDIPAGIESGASTLQVVTNGIGSAGIAITVTTR